MVKVKVRILDENGDSTVLCETQEKIDTIVKENAGRWFYVDGNFHDGLKLGEVTMDGIREIVISEPLIGG